MVLLNGDGSTDSNPNPSVPSLARDSMSNAQDAEAKQSLVNGNSVSSLNPRSCTTCRKRKIRCDKKHPCSNCKKTGVECIFPGPGRAPRRNKKPQETELLLRLKALEGVVQDLRTGLEEGDIEAEPENGAPRPTNTDHVGRSECNIGMFGIHNPSNGADESDKMVKEFGRLKVQGGRSRYVSNKFWVSLSEEVRCKECSMLIIFLIRLNAPWF